MPDYDLQIDGANMNLHWDKPTPPTKQDIEGIVKKYRASYKTSPAIGKGSAVKGQTPEQSRQVVEGMKRNSPEHKAQVEQHLKDLGASAKQTANESGQELSTALRQQLTKRGAPVTTHNQDVAAANKAGNELYLHGTPANQKKFAGAEAKRLDPGTQPSGNPILDVLSGLSGATPRQVQQTVTSRPGATGEAAQLVTSFADPSNIAIMMTLPEASPMIQRVVSMAFSLQLGHGAYEAANDKALKKSDPNKYYARVLSLGVLGGLAGTHAIAPKLIPSLMEKVKAKLEQGKIETPIDRTTAGREKRNTTTPKKPAPTPEEAYATSKKKAAIESIRKNAPQRPPGATQERPAPEGEQTTTPRQEAPKPVKAHVAEPHVKAAMGKSALEGTAKARDAYESWLNGRRPTAALKAEFAQHLLDLHKSGKYQLEGPGSASKPADIFTAMGADGKPIKIWGFNEKGGSHAVSEQSAGTQVLRTKSEGASGVVELPGVVGSHLTQTPSEEPTKAQEEVAPEKYNRRSLAEVYEQAKDPDGYATLEERERIEEWKRTKRSLYDEIAEYEAKGGTKAGVRAKFGKRLDALRVMFFMPPEESAASSSSPSKESVGSRLSALPLIESGEEPQNTQPTTDTTLPDVLGSKNSPIGEKPKPDPDAVGARNEISQAIREKYGFDDRPDHEVEKWDTSFEKGRELLKRGGGDPASNAIGLAHQLMNEKRAARPEEATALVVALRDLEDQSAEMHEAVSKAILEGDKGTINHLEHSQKELQAKIKTILEANEKWGTEAGRAMYLRQALLKADASKPERMLHKARSIKGSNLTPEEEANIRKESAEYKELLEAEEKTSELLRQDLERERAARPTKEGQTPDERAQERAEEMVPKPGEVPKNAPRFKSRAKPSEPDFGEGNVYFPKQEGSLALERAKARLAQAQKNVAGKLSSDPLGVGALGEFGKALAESIPDLIEYGGYLVEGGLRRFEPWALSMKQDLGDVPDAYLQHVWGKVREALAEKFKKELPEPSHVLVDQLGSKWSRISTGQFLDRVKSGSGGPEILRKLLTQEELTPVEVAQVEDAYRATVATKVRKSKPKDPGIDTINDIVSTARKEGRIESATVKQRKALSPTDQVIRRLSGVMGRSGFAKFRSTIGTDVWKRWLDDTQSEEDKQLIAKTYESLRRQATPAGEPIPPIKTLNEAVSEYRQEVRQGLEAKIKGSLGKENYEDFRQKIGPLWQRLVDNTANETDLRAISEQYLSYGKRVAKRPAPAATGGVKALQEAALALRKEYGVRDDIKRLDDVLKAIKEGTYKKPPPEPEKYKTPELIRLQNLRALKQANVSAQLRYLKPWTSWDWARNINRSFVLSGYSVLEKLAGATAWYIPFSHIENLVGASAGYLPTLVKEGGEYKLRRLKDLAASQGEFNFGIEGHKYVDALSKETAYRIGASFRRGFNDIDAAKSGIDEFAGSGVDMMDFFKKGTSASTRAKIALEAAPRLHGAEKAILQSVVYHESLSYQIAKFRRIQGRMPTEEEMTAMNYRAAMDSTEAKLQEDRALTGWVNRVMVSAEDSPYKGVKSVGLLLRTLFPITKVPLNFLSRSIDYTGLGVVKGLRKYAQITVETSRGNAEITPQLADDALKAFKRGGTGLLLAYLAANAKNIFKGGGVYTGDRRMAKHPLNNLKPGEISVGGHKLPAVFSHSPIATGAFQFWEVLLAPPVKGGGAMATARGVVNEVPGLEGASKILTAATTGESAGSVFGDYFRNLVVPQGVQQLAQYQDRTPGGNVRKRYPRNIGQSIEEGIPGVRKKVPLTKKPKGQ